MPSSLPTETSVSIKDKSDREAKSSTERELKFSLEVDGVSVQFDVQEKSTDLVVKVSGAGANLHRRNFMATSGEGGGKDSQPWVPYLSSEKLFSSRGSTLPHDLSEILTHSSSAGMYVRMYGVLQACVCVGNLSLSLSLSTQPYICLKGTPSPVIHSETL